MCFGKRKKRENFDLSEIFVLSVYIISSYNDDSGSPKVAKMKLLAKKENGKFFEIFSNKEIKECNAGTNNTLFQKFDEPYIEKIEMLSKYIEVSPKYKFSKTDLFDIIMNINVMKMVSN